MALEYKDLEGLTYKQADRVMAEKNFAIIINSFSELTEDTVFTKEMVIEGMESGYKTGYQWGLIIGKIRAMSEFTEAIEK